MSFTVYKTREEWLAARASDPTTISASEAAMALGVSPFGGPWDLIARKRGEASVQTAATQLGQRWEARVLEDYAFEAGVEIINAGRALTGRSGILLGRRDFITASPDAAALDRGVYGLVEAKATIKADEWTTEPAEIEVWTEEAATLCPPAYAIQCYLQLFVTELPWVELVAMVPGRPWPELRRVRIHHDASIIGRLVSALSDWRERHLIRGEAPDFDGSAAADRELARTFSGAPARAATAEEAALLTELHAVRSQAKALADQEALLTQRVAAIGVGRLIGPVTATVSKVKGRTTIDAAALQANFPDAYAATVRVGNPYLSVRTKEAK